MTATLATVEAFLRGFEDDPLQDGIADMLDAVRPAQRRMDDLVDALATALPYVEDQEDSPAFKGGIVKRHARLMRALIEGTDTTDRADAMRLLLARAVADWPQLDRSGDGELNVSGADLVDWFGEWRESAKALLDITPA